MLKSFDQANMLVQGRFYLAAFLESDNVPLQGKQYPGINSATAG